ncbi:glycosyltransferase [Rhodopseudomonas palustris]|uniref:glycosyltransferase family 2 protein n=1 Tax=Rhodopseudomonas palustris TaxID=1076 RepID=UPI0021F399DE|nr:glycosyltransferase family 2 protein [Rhodopseudomonas palustris]UYO44338.1 glycosyltransferase [Rhodopseudomonas palustris]
MLISIIVPFYSEIELIGELVSSVSSQTDLSDGIEFEICIGNDGAYTTSEIRAAIIESHRHRILIERNRFDKGPGGARNTAIELSSGEIIAFLDADDVWLPGKTVAQLRAIESGATFVAGAYRFRNRGTIVKPPKVISRPFDVFWRQGIGTSTVMMRRDLIGETRFRDFRFGQDIDFWYRIASKSGFVYECAEMPVTVYSTEGSTRSKLRQAISFWSVLQQNKLPLSLQLMALSRYAARGIFHHYLAGKIWKWPRG